MITMTKERLAAFADGELSPEEAAGVVMHLADHPEDQAYVDDLLAANLALSRAFSAPMTEAVPAAILATIQGKETARILPFRRRNLASVTGLALAASLVGAVLWMSGLGVTQVPTGFAPGPLAEGSDLFDGVTSLPSGETVTLATGAELTLLASLPVSGGYCREAELIDRSLGTLSVALVCTQRDGWQVKVALTEALPKDVEGFVPAGGPETEAISLWLDRLGAGMALSPQDEANAITKGWEN